MHLLKRNRIILPADAISMKARRGGKLIDLAKLGFMPQIAGGATGYNQGGDVVTVTADGRDLNQIWSDFQAALDLYNAERNRLLNILTFNVTNPIEDVFQGGGTVDFEKATEFGVPRGIRTPTPNFFSLGYDFDWWDVAIRFTWVFLAESTQAQVDSLNNSALEADNRLLFHEVMKAIFNMDTREASINQQNFSVYPFYNGDGTTPPTYKGVTPDSPHSHYLASGGAAVDSGDLDDMETHLKHHGYTWQTGTTLLLIVNSAQAAVIRTFRVADGDSYDFLLSQGNPPWFPPDANLALYPPNANPAPALSGLPVIGRYGQWLVIEDDLVPAGYMLGLASGGELSAQNPVGIREHANTALRGLRLVKGPDPDYPLVDSYYQRGFGTGIRQRGAGVVMQIKSMGTYDIPETYTESIG